jgi:hypothetical protein
LSPRIVTATRPCVSIKRTTLTNPSRWFPAHGITWSPSRALARITSHDTKSYPPDNTSDDGQRRCKALLNALAA